MLSWFEDVNPKITRSSYAKNELEENLENVLNAMSEKSEPYTKPFHHATKVLVKFLMGTGIWQE